MTTSSEAPTKPPDGEHRVVIRQVGWEGYQSLQRMVGDQPVRSGKTLRVLLRRDDGSYDNSSAGAVFPDVPMDEIARFAAREGIRDENAFLDEFSAWVRQVVVPRIKGPADA